MQERWRRLGKLLSGELTNRSDGVAAGRHLDTILKVVKIIDVPADVITR